MAEVTFDELESYDVGSWFSPDYKDLRVATLDATRSFFIAAGRTSDAYA